MGRAPDWAFGSPGVGSPEGLFAGGAVGAAFTILTSARPACDPAKPCPAGATGSGELCPGAVLRATYASLTFETVSTRRAR